MRVVFDLVIGHGYQPVAQLGRPTLRRAQCPLLVLCLVVFSAGIHVFLAVPQHGIDKSGQLVGRGRDGLGSAQMGFLPAQEAAQGCRSGAGRGRPDATLRPPLALVFELMTLPPVIRLLRLSVNGGGTNLPTTAGDKGPWEQRGSPLFLDPGPVWKHFDTNNDTPGARRTPGVSLSPVNCHSLLRGFQPPLATPPG